MDGTVMMRIVFVLLMVVSVFIGLILFPELANQRVRIEMLGWLFETRTGMFILLILFVLGSLWFLQKIFNLSINSPKQLWSNLRSGNKKRRELRLQEAMDTWIDEGEGHSQKLLKRSKGIVPDWLHESLLIWWEDPAAHAKINDEKDSPRMLALKARLATAPANKQQLSLSERQQYLDVWLAVHPAAPLALQRKAVLLGELGEYQEQVSLLEDLWNKKRNVITIKPLLASALRCLAAKDSENKLAHLRKANRINPLDIDVLLGLSTALHDAGDHQSSTRLLLDHLSQHDDMKIAQSVLPMLTDNPLQHFKAVDKPRFQNTMAGRWLRIMLAHQAALIGIAEDGLHLLLEKEPSAQLWQIRGDWFTEKQQWQKAAEAYQKALSLTD